MINVVLIDDDILNRSQLKTAMEHNGITVIAEGASADEAVALYAEFKPDVIVIDLHLFGRSGLYAMVKIKKMYHDAKIVALASTQSEFYINKCVKNGVLGYMMKYDRMSEIVLSVRKAADRIPHFSADIADKIFNIHGKISSNLSLLTAAEFEAVQLLAMGKSIKAISLILKIKRETAHVHKYKAFKKLHISSLEELLRLAVLEQLLPTCYLNELTGVA